MKKKTRAKPKDLKAKKNPKGGGVIMPDRGGGSANPSGIKLNHNETLVAGAA